MWMTSHQNITGCNSPCPHLFIIAERFIICGPLILKMSEPDEKESLVSFYDFYRIKPDISPILIY